VLDTVLTSLGSLLLYLTGNGLDIFTSQTPSTSAMMGEFSVFVQEAKFRIINPLCLDSSCARFASVFRTATKLLEMGWLASVRDLEAFLVSSLMVCQDQYRRFPCISSSTNRQ
jgi:hypothetical protein